METNLHNNLQTFAICTTFPPTPNQLLPMVCKERPNYNPITYQMGHFRWFCRSWLPLDCVYMTQIKYHMPFPRILANMKSESIGSEFISNGKYSIKWSIDHFRLNGLISLHIIIWNYSELSNDKNIAKFRIYACQTQQRVNFPRFLWKKYAVYQNSDGSVYNTSQWVLTPVAAKNRPNSFCQRSSPTPTISVTKMNLVYFLMLIGSTLIEMCCIPLVV